VKVVRGIGSQNGSFAAWLFRIAANVANDHFRQARSHRETAMTEAVSQGAASRDQPAAAVGRALDIQAAMAHLTDDQCELVTLKFIEGLSNAEIAEATGRSPEAIRILQFRALAAMRKFLQSEDHDDGDKR